MPRTIETMVTLAEALGRILALAEPGGAIETSLGDAIGLVLAEPVVADVDLPPFDRASRSGYAVRAAEARVGALLRVADLRWPGRPGDELGVEAAEAVPVASGDGLPVGADAVIGLEDVRADPGSDPARVVEVIRAPEVGQHVARRGSMLGAGGVLAEAGTRLKPSMVPLLASQGGVSPICHRRARVAILAVGDHLISPAEAPIMNRERNASNGMLAALTIGLGAMPHDFQSVAESRFRAALERATTAPLILILGPSTRSTARGLRSIGVEPVFRGVAFRPGGKSRYGVVRDDSGRVAHHVFQLPLGPIAASTAFLLLVKPLIARLQGALSNASTTTPAAWEGDLQPARDQVRAIPATVRIEAGARRVARPVPLQGAGDLPGFALADGLALIPAGAGPKRPGDLVEVVGFD